MLVELRADRDRPGDREEPLLPGAALQRHGLPGPDRARLDAGGSRRRAAGRWCAPRRSRSTTPRTSPPTSSSGSGTTVTSRPLARVADRIHEFGALAGIELAYNGPNGANSYGREVPLAPSAQCLWPPRTTTRSSTARRRPATRSPSGASSPSFSPSTGPDPLHGPRARARRRPAQSRSGSVRQTRFGPCGPDTELSDA